MYDVNKLVKLSNMKTLAQKVKDTTDTLATKEAIKDMETKTNAAATYATKASLGDYAKKADISSAYKPQGSIDFSALTGLNTQENLGNVYDVNDAFTTNENFLEGTGKNYPAHTNVVVVNDSGAYKFDALSGFVDLTDYAKTEQLPKNFIGATEEAGKDGLVPAPQIEDATKYLKGDGTWGTPENTTYEVATTMENGLMSSEDKEKLDGMKVADDDEVTEMVNEVFPAE